MGLIFLLIQSNVARAQSQSGQFAWAEGPLLFARPALLTAKVYSRGDHQLLFNFTRTAKIVGTNVDVLRDFTYPDGRLAAREHLIYHGDQLALYELEHTQTGGKGFARIDPDPKDPGRQIISFLYDKTGGSLAQQRPFAETFNPDMLANDMMGDWISRVFDRLEQGARVSCRCIVVSHRDTYGLTLVKQGDSTWHGKDVITVKMQPSSFLISALVEPVYFTIEKAPPHRVLEYTGRTTPKILEHGHWKDLDAVTVFDW